MGLRFYIGASGAGKSYRLYEDVIKWSMEDPMTNYLVIVPDQFTMQTQKDIVLQHPKHGIMNIDVLSFGRLSHRIFEEIGGNDLTVLDDTGKSLILRKIANEEAQKLTVIGGNLKKIGYIHEVKSSISEFMQYGIGSKELTEMIDYASQKGALQYKLQDLKVLYESFLDYIKGDFITTEESLTILKKALPKSEMIPNSVILLDGFTGFTPVQNALIQELMIRSKDVIITAVIDGKEDPYHQGGEQQLFYLSKKMVTTMEKLASDAGVTRKTDVILQGNPVKRQEHNESLSYLEQALFRFGIKPYEQEQHQVSIYEAQNPSAEVHHLCKQIHALIREQGYCYRDIAVVTGDLPGYAHFIENEFEKYAIPCFLDQTSGIVLNPAIEYIRSGLSVVNRGFSYETIFHYLRSGMVPLETERIDRMENYVLAMGICGKKQWTSMWTRRPSVPKLMGTNDTATEALLRLNQDRAYVILCLQPLIELKKNSTVEDIVKQVYAFVIRIDMQMQLQRWENRFQREGKLSRAKEYAQIYPLIMDLFNQIVELLGSTKMTLLEFAQILDTGFGEIQVGTIPQNADQIVVGDIERTRLKKIKALFFIGINDGIIPKHSGSGGLLSDIDREFLQDAGLELSPTPRQQMYIQRLYLYMNMTKPTDRLYLSYAVVNGEGKSLRPAYLIDTIKKLYPHLTIEKDTDVTLEQELVTPQASKLYLVQQLREYAEGHMEQTDELFALYHWFQTSALYQKELSRLLQAAFYEYKSSPLSKIVAQSLYGSVLENSVSSLERYAACAYAHFLQYGLALQERDTYSFEAVDMGNIFHGVLENFANRLADTPYTWIDFPKKMGEQLVEEALDAYTAAYGESVLFSSARNEYMITRMKRILRRTVSTLQYQLQKGVFQPGHAELAFSTSLQGRIDRVDLYEDEDAVYIKVLDYKSGHKSFDLVSLYYGLQLQLVAYLNVAVELAAKEYPKKTIIPAAVLYYHVSDPIVETQSSQINHEQLELRLLEELKTTGVINANHDIPSKLDTSMTTTSDIIPIAYKKDGTYTAASSVLDEKDLQSISKYVNKKIKTIGNDICAGHIEVNPYQMGMQSSCSYCAYAGICGYDKRIIGYEMRSLDGMNKEEALRKIEEES
ncbi:MAG: helicase-exonuclease AddAB subunit AddB [Lachnospiraceae bacterium]